MRASVIREGDRILVRSGAKRVIAEIDLLNEVIRTVASGFNLNRFRSRSLNEFASIALHKNVRTIEEGFLVAEYTVVLQGTQSTLQIYSTYNQDEAVMMTKELGSVLSLLCSNPESDAARTSDNPFLPGLTG